MFQENHTCDEQPCGRPCRIRDVGWGITQTGICDGEGRCVHLWDNPCDRNGCKGKQCGEDCLAGDIAGWCDANGNCDVTNDNPDCEGMQI